MNCRCNKLIIGLIAGLILPVLTAWLIYRLRYEGIYEFQDFMRGLIVLKSLGKLISISVLPNLAVFMLAVTFERLLFARGLVFATFFWVIVVLLVKFLL
jgi:hypothetical protein